jgi:hypothetical protein
MRLLLLKEGLAISVGPFTFIPNHVTKATAALGIAAVSMAYSAKEFGHHYSELALDQQPREQRLKEGN